MVFDYKVEIFHSGVIVNRVMQCSGVICVTIMFIMYCIQNCYSYRLKQMQKHVEFVECSIPSDSPGTPSDSPNNIDIMTTNNKQSTKIKKNLTRSEKRMTRYVYLEKLLTTFIQIIFLIFLIIFASNFFGFFENKCNLMAKVATSIWSTARFSLYYLLVLRIKIAFGNSLFGYRNRTFIMLLVWITFCFMCQIWSAVVEITGEKRDGFCQIYCPYVAIFMALAADGPISVICLILFIKPLIYIIKNSGNSEKEFANTAFKCTLLAVLAVISSGLWFLTQIFIPTGGILSAVDSVINTLCVALMDKSCEYVYGILCKPCTKAFIGVMDK
eukprot:41436_1